MTDYDRLRMALRNMQDAEGTVATEQLVHDALAAVATRDDKRRAKKLTAIRGMGTSSALEVMASLGWFMEEDDGTAN